METETRPPLSRLPRPSVTGVVAVAVAAGFIVWLATRNDGGSTATSSAVPSATVATSTPASTTSQSSTVSTAGGFGPVALTAPALRAQVALLGQRAYWAGPMRNSTYELTRTDSGSIYIRYLPPGVAAGDKRAFLTIGTYPLPNAYAVTQRVVNEKGAVSRKLADGSIAVYRPARPTSIYIAQPGGVYQIEVYDPSVAEARRLVTTGEIRQVP